MKEKSRNMLKKVKRFSALYISESKLVIIYILFALLGTILLRAFTVRNIWNMKPFLADLAIITLVGSFGCLLNSKKQSIYYMAWLIIYALTEFINHIYYIFYNSFASFSELSGLSQAETVTGAIFEKLVPLNFIYILIPILFYFVSKKIVESPTTRIYEKVKNNKVVFITTLLIGATFMAVNLSLATKTDYSRLIKQWNRGAIVERFGIIMYQGNDLVQTLTPKINSLFGYEEAVKTFKEYFREKDTKHKKNQYTNILENKNIIFVHMESMQNFLMNLEFNGEEVTPTINALAREGLFFENFYPQVSSGTSSDSEFTLLTSLMPASSGIVFTSYYERNYITIPKLLSDKGYYTFSMHGNYSSMWNREKVHPKLGYQEMYFRDTFETPVKEDKDYINLGISDSLFYKQAMPKLETIEAEHENYIGTIITLSNHSPFQFLDKYGEFDLSREVIDENGEIIKVDYLSDTAVGNYIRSAHYADVSLGEFITYIKNSSAFENTVFVFYGDHDAKLTRKEINVLYNTNPLTHELYKEEDEEYVTYNYIAHDLNKKTPLIIWSKDKTLQEKLKGRVEYVMGMIDVMPTLGNMLGIQNDFALGHDIFDIKTKNIVAFPNGNFITHYVYYNNSREEYSPIKLGVSLEEDYIEECKSYTEEVINISNLIIVHDLIYNEGSDLESEEIKGKKE